MPKARKTRATASARQDPLSERSANPQRKASTPIKSEVKRSTSARSSSIDRTTTPIKHEFKKSTSPEPISTKTSTPSIKPEEADETKASIARGSLTTSVPTLPTDQSNYLIQVRIVTTENPVVSRLLSLPPTFTFEQVHEALVIAFNWFDMHTHGFNIWTSDFQGMTLDGQACGGAVKMRIGPEDPIDGLGIDGPPKKDESEITLQDVYEDPQYGGKAVIGYEYDFGDGWGHVFTLIGRATPDIHSQIHMPSKITVACLGGEGHHVAEDCGGGAGWEDLKDCFKRGKRADPDDRRGWYREDCANGGKEKFDPYQWDIFEVNDQLISTFCPEVLERETRESSASGSMG